MMKRRFQDTLSHPESLARENHQQKTPAETKNRTLSFFYYYYYKIEKLEVETAAQGHSDETAHKSLSSTARGQEGGRK